MICNLLVSLHLTNQVPRHLTYNGCSLSRMSGFRLFPVRSPLLGKSLLFSFPPVTEMFHFSGLAAINYVFIYGQYEFIVSSFPIRKSSDLSPLDGSPRLIAACYALLRLSVPRHSPYTLSILIHKMHSYRNQNVKDLSSNQIKRINSISKIFNLSRAICVLFFKEG